LSFSVLTCRALSDLDKDNKFSKLEFSVALHLIECKRLKGMEIPDSLPPSIVLALQGQAKPAVFNPFATNVTQPVLPQGPSPQELAGRVRFYFLFFSCVNSHF
jgi:hypothetical protein